jgi:hypothetical protein
VVRHSIFVFAVFCFGCGDDSFGAGGGSGPEPLLPRCGNGIVEDGEFCDAGGANNNIVPNACRIDCTLPFCGDGVRDDTEECDLGEQNGGGECTQGCESLLADTTSGSATNTDASTTIVDATAESSSSSGASTADTTAEDTTAGVTTVGDTTSVSGMSGMMEGGGND